MRSLLLILASLILFGTALMSGPAAAQTDTPTPTASGPSAPAFTIDDLNREISELGPPETRTNTDGQTVRLTPAESVVEQRRAFLTTASEQLQSAARQSERLMRWRNDLEMGPRVLDDLRKQIIAQQTDMDSRARMDADAAVVGEEAMFQTEQILLSKESELRALQAEIDGYRTQLAEISARQTAAPAELSAARSALSEITPALAELGEGETDALGEARRKSLRARDYARRSQIASLEAELAALPTRVEIVNARRSLAELRAEVLGDDVRTLQDLTGQRKVVEANRQAGEVSALAEELAPSHPLSAEIAQDNLRLAEMLTSMAADEPLSSRRQASIRGRTANVRNDLTAARSLVDLETIDREAGATLRRLGNQIEPGAQLRSDLRDIRQTKAKLTREQVLAQEQLRDMAVGRVDVDGLFARARASEPTLPELDDPARAAIAQLAEQRRVLLRQVVSTASSRIADLGELEEAQIALGDASEELRALLDENLLWVPSVPAISFDWPRRVALGAAELFSPQHMQLAGGVLATQAARYWLLVLLFGGATALLWRLRPVLWADIVDRSAMVGKVREDSLWHTPAVVGASLLMSLPLPIGFALLAVLFARSPNPDLLIGGLADGFAFLSVFTVIFLSWRIWDRDRSLFGAHFKLPKPLRMEVQRNLRWFVPVVGTLSFLLAVTSDMRGDNIYAGLSVFVFIATALSLAYFSFRVVWRKRAAYAQTFAADNVETGLSRYRGPIALLVVGLPIIAAIMAGAGWYESGRDLLWRIFLTGLILHFTYVIYGSIRRAITVAQRQIKYRQAVERREQKLRQRAEAQAAEERGEQVPAPPPIDTDEIDVSAMSRQSAQLLRVIAALGVAVLIWLTWSGLLPALSIFDGLEISRIDTGEQDQAGNAIYRVISVWTVLQACVIAALTIVAARNLPGFLEIFVLDRLGMDAGARYAVVTILGYIIIGTGIVMAFNRLGLQWDQLRWIVTGLSVGIGFGLQKIIANFVSGLILLFERPIRIGDYVTIGAESGTVTRIKIRATTLQDLDNREILIPNENLISQEVTNWTLSNSTTRLICTVGIAYGSDTDKARELMLGVLKRNPKILDLPPPNVLFVNFGDSSLDFELRAFLKAFEDRWPVKHAIHTEVNKVLAENGFEIPFPQRDLNWRGQDGPMELRNAGPKKPGEWFEEAAEE